MSQVQSKWKGLSTQYFKEEDDLPKPKSGAEGDLPIESTWKHFKALGFLKGVNKKKKSEGNADDSSDSDNEQEIKKKSKKRKNNDERVDKPQSMEPKNLEINKPNEGNTMDLKTDAEWKHLQSLLPYIQEIEDPDNKFLFRLQAMFSLYKLKTAASQARVKTPPKIKPSSSACSSAMASTSTSTLEASVPSKIVVKSESLPKTVPLNNAPCLATASTSTSTSTLEVPVPPMVLAKKENCQETTDICPAKVTVKKENTSTIVVNGSYYYY